MKLSKSIVFLCFPLFISSCVSSPDPAPNPSPTERIIERHVIEKPEPARIEVKPYFNDKTTYFYGDIVTFTMNIDIIGDIKPATKLGYILYLSHVDSREKFYLKEEYINVTKKNYKHKIFLKNSLQECMLLI